MRAPIRHTPGPISRPHASSGRAEHAMRSYSIEQLFAWLEGSLELPRGTFILPFDDDGWKIGPYAFSAVHFRRL